MESEAKKKWQKENATTYTVKLQKKYDSDIIGYMEKQVSKSDTIKKAIRLLITTGTENK